MPSLPGTPHASQDEALSPAALAAHLAVASLPAEEALLSWRTELAALLLQPAKCENYTYERAEKLFDSVYICHCGQGHEMYNEQGEITADFGMKCTLCLHYPPTFQCAMCCKFGKIEGETTKFLEWAAKELGFAHITLHRHPPKQELPPWMIP